MLRRRLISVCLFAAVAYVLSPSAHAYPFHRILRRGARGPDVTALKMRVAGWFSSPARNAFWLSGPYNWKTVAAVRNFQRHYGLTADGIAGPATFRVLNALEDPDHSTAHF